MTGQSRGPSARTAGRIATATTLTVGWIVAFAAVASADPAPAPPMPGQTALPDEDISVPPPPDVPAASGLQNTLAQNGHDANGPGGFPTLLPAFVGDQPNEFLLAQAPTPVLRKSDALPTGSTNPNLNPLNNQYMLPRNLKPSAPGKGQLYDVDPGDENADNSNTDYLKHLWHGYQDGMWNGALVGRRPKAELNEPLPNTAPPPGTRIPGLADDSQGPAPDQWHWSPPDAPDGAAPGPVAPAAPVNP